MSFIQVIDCTTHRPEELSRLMDDWVSVTQGKRTATHSIVGRDRADPSHVVEIVEFPSYEDAQRNSRLPETDQIYREMVAACETPPQFTDLDVIRDEQLNKSTAQRFFEEIVNERRLDVFDELFDRDYQEHDAVGLPGRGYEEAKATCELHLHAFGPTMTIETQIAEGDLVTTRWHAVGAHRGAFQGIEPTGRPVTTTGHTTFRFDHRGRIVEGWWNWDYVSLLSQIGVVEL